MTSAQKTQILNYLPEIIDYISKEKIKPIDHTHIISSAIYNDGSTMGIKIITDVMFPSLGARRFPLFVGFSPDKDYADTLMFGVLAIDRDEVRGFPVLKDDNVGNGIFVVPYTLDEAFFAKQSNEQKEILAKWIYRRATTDVHIFYELLNTEAKCLLAKNEIALLLVPELILKTYEHINQLKEIIKNYEDEKCRDRNTAPYWICLNTWCGGKYFLSFVVPDDKKKLYDFKTLEDVYYDYGEYYVPYNSENAKIIDENACLKLKTEIEKNTELSEWFSEPDRRIKEIHIVYGFADKLCSLVSDFLEWQKKPFSVNDELCNAKGVGYYIEDRTKFLGLSLDIIEFLKSKSNNSTEKSEKYNYDEVFSLAVINNSLNKTKCERDGIFTNGFYYFFPLNAEKELFYNFLLSESAEEQQTNFNLLIEKVLQNTQKYK